MRFVWEEINGDLLSLEQEGMKRMQEHLANARATCPEHLEQAPHVLAQVLDLFGGASLPSPEQRQQLVRHLAVCMHCQIGIELVLQELLERAEGRAAEQARSLLTFWLDLTHTVLAGQIPSYVDAVLAQGEHKASACFPVLAQHLHSCGNCREEVRVLCEWLA